MHEIRHYALPVALLAIAACAAPGVMPGNEIKARADSWEVAFNAGDLDKLAGIYTENARLLPPGGKLVTGRDAAREILQRMISSGVKGELTTVEAMASGDMGYEVATYMFLTPQGTEADHGKVISTWRRVRGEWMIDNVIWNSDVPAAGPAGTRLLITHDVKDGDHWLAAWRGPESRRTLFAGHGVPSVRVFQSGDDPIHVALLVGVTDMDAFKALLQSPEGERAEEEDGVIVPTIRMLREVE